MRLRLLFFKKYPAKLFKSGGVWLVMDFRRLAPVVGAGLGIATLIILPSLFSLLADYFWFDNLTYGSVFTTIFFTKLALAFLFALVAFLVYYLPHILLLRKLKQPKKLYFHVGIVLAALAGLSASGLWEQVLLFFNATTFALADPVFGHDIGFYVFQLPLLTRLVFSLFMLFVITFMSLVITVIVATPGKIRQVDEFGIEHPLKDYDFAAAWKKVESEPVLLALFSGLGGALLLLLAALLYLNRFMLLYSRRGAVFGAAFTDVYISLPVLNILVFLSIVTAIALLSFWKVRSVKLLAVLLSLLVIIGIGGGIVASVVQGLLVEPDEFNKEELFIERNIHFTDVAYGLDKVEESQYELASNLTLESLERNPGTVKNIRVWDWRPLLKTYNELQIFRTYYTFLDVDIDRYMLDDELIQLMISPREMNTAALSPESRTWVNRHLVYTHGYGVVASPMNEISQGGLPTLYLKDIPPVPSDGLRVDRPEIYFGENTKDYVVVRTTTKELDYPSGNDNVYVNYEGSGGIQLSGFKRLAFSVKFADLKLFFSDSLTEESRIMLHRDIRDRARTIAPFLRYDRDPYIVVAEDRLYWIYDAYTVTDRYPYSKPFSTLPGEMNYIRNSVKVVIDAYTGETTFYAIGEDPLRDAYAKIFPALFTPLDEMPAALRPHLRYPQDLFEAQSHIYLDYHMKDPKVFYNREDSWEIPDEVYRGSTQRMEPYYIIMSLPGTGREEFIQIQPFVPRGKQNLIGWMTARSDPPHYGELQTFLFSKQELAFGPLQIEARIDQDADISQEITLWSSAGSNVIRGNLIALPIENSILYIEPLFLVSTQKGTLPEVKRVILAEGDRLTMMPDLDSALTALLSRDSSDVLDSVGSGVVLDVHALVDEALQYYAQADECLREGDLAGYAENMRLVKVSLDEISGSSDASDS